MVTIKEDLNRNTTAMPRSNPAPSRFAVKVTADSHFAWLRTRASLERTLMSCIRTAISSIGFGFTIVQFFDRLQQFSGVKPAVFSDAPWYVGLALIFCGVLALVVSLWQYRLGVRYLWSDSFLPLAGTTNEGMQSSAVAVALVLIAVGTLAFLAVLFRLT
jgi:putative membrane protein